MAVPNVMIFNQKLFVPYFHHSHHRSPAALGYNVLFDVIMLIV